ncbi:hypothetical protein [Natrinema caseinilyticum]|uniref:hypothetical protein n=1 Tax=Natrinema caseinilyticum TaxID=2961570 RepID=UPI0020C52EA2|nr:hypothetical protein [Natrinema caseinilyticum]
MVVSAAIGELAEILARLEQTDREVRSVALSETDGDAETVTARVGVSTPVIDGGTLSDDVTVEAAESELTDGRVDVTLEFTIPAGAGEVAFESRQSRQLQGAVKQTETYESTAGTASYKDPDVLETVYERYDSFPKMTEALGVDVTSETVRRYMVKYGIHDPDDSSADATDRTGDERETVSGDDATGGGERAKDPSADSNAASSPVDESPAPEDGTESESTADEPEPSEFGERSVAEILAETNLEEDESLVADGVGVQRNLTVADLTEILERSRTVSEVKRALDLDHDQTRRVLNELGVISFVTGRLTDPRDDITLADVERCVRNG